MSLADELLADLEAQDEEEVMEEALAEGLEEVGTAAAGSKMELSGEGRDAKTNGAWLTPKAEVRDADEGKAVVDKKLQSVRSLAKLRHGRLLARVMSDIETFSAKGKREPSEFSSVLSPREIFSEG